MSRLITQAALARDLGCVSQTLTYYRRRNQLIASPEGLIDADQPFVAELRKKFAQGRKQLNGAPRRPGGLPIYEKEIDARGSYSQRVIGDAPQPAPPAQQRDCAALAVQYAEDVVAGKIITGKLA